MNNNAVITISFTAWKSPAVIAKLVPSPIPNPMKPSSPTAKNPIILLKSVCVSASETPKIIAKIEKKTMSTSKIGSTENILNIINTMEIIETTVNDCSNAAP